jgi:hypothetical protein
VWRRGAVAARGFHDEHIGADVFKPRALQDGLVVKADVAGVKDGLAFAAHQHAGGAEGVAGVVKFQRGRLEAGAGFLERGPFDLAVVFEALKERGDVVHLVVRVERVFLDAQFVPLAGHDVDGIVQHAFDDVVAQLRHEHMRVGEMPQRHRQRADVVMVTVRDRNGVHIIRLGRVVERQAGLALQLRVGAGVQQKPVAVQLHKPGTGANVGVRVQIGNPHGTHSDRNSRKVKRSCGEHEA